MTRRAWAAAFFVLLTAACAALVALHWHDKDTMVYTCYAVKPVASVQPYAWPHGNVNVNTADYDVLRTLKGISRSQIEALLEDRNQHGAYDFPEDIIYVKGIGEKTLEKIFDQLDFSWKTN